MTALVDYAELLALVHELIQGTGRSLTFSKLDQTEVDSSKPWLPIGLPAEATSTVFGTFVPPNQAVSMGIDIGDSELFKSFESVALVEPNVAADLDSYHTVQDGTDVWRVEKVSVLKPGSVVLLYVFGLCK
jgi:hypothetical protein